MSRTTLAISRRSFAEPGSRGTAVAHAILVRVAAGELPAILRLHRPGAILAFSKHDAASPGFRAAVSAARAAGFEPVIRLAGGRAAVYHEGTLALAWAVPDPHPMARTEERFRELAELLAASLRRLGVDSSIGEIPGEYCPGAWSVNAEGRTKLVGTGQRLIAGAAHRGAVVVVTDSERIRDVLVPVYEALGLEWDPATAGSVQDEVGEITVADVERAILSELAESHDLAEIEIDDATLALSQRLESDHRVP